MTRMTALEEYRFERKQSKAQMECPGALICGITYCYHYREHAKRGCGGICFGTNGCVPIKEREKLKC